MIDVGYKLEYVGYTVESLDDVEDIIREIDKIDNTAINHYRIRCGSFIGKSSDKKRSYLSNLVKKVQSILGDEVSYGSYDDNPYHVMLNWKNTKLRLIQWPDVTNIDMEELATGPWGQFYNGPVTNFVHQVITRDAFKNNGLPMLDFCPVEYQYQSADSRRTHWKNGWEGPIEVEDLIWTPNSVKTKKLFYLTQPVELARINR
jgi:hypothetical protein